MSTVRRKPAAEINADVSQYAQHIERVVAHHGGTTEHPLGDWETHAIPEAGVIHYDAPEPDAEQTAYDLEQHTHRRRIDWWRVGGIVACLVSAAIATAAIVGAVGVVEGWW